MKPIISLFLMLLPFVAGAQTSTPPSNWQNYLHGQFEITNGGDGAAKSFSRVEIVNDVFGHRITVLGVNMETGQETVDEYAIDEIKPSTKTAWYSGVIVCSRIDASKERVSRNFVYNQLKENSFKLNFEGQLLTLARIEEKKEAAPAAVSRPAAPTTTSRPAAPTPTSTSTSSRPTATTGNLQRPAATTSSSRPTATTATTNNKPAAAYGSAAASPYVNTTADTRVTVSGVAAFRIPNGQTVWPATPLKDKTITFKVKGIEVKMVLVDDNEYLMGCGSGGSADVTPLHQVAITRSYYIMTTEVTQGLWLAVMGTFPEGFRFTGYNNPMTGITWNEAWTFCSTLRQQSNLSFSLPTEAQWELAAKGAGADQKYTRYGGSDDINEVAWYKGNAGGYVHPVAAKKPNVLGLYDMSGNVAEWVLDYYGPYTKDRISNGTGRQTPANATNRIVRGGSVITDAKAALPQQRQEQNPNTHSDYIGFRFVINN